MCCSILIKNIEGGRGKVILQGLTPKDPETLDNIMPKIL